MTDQITSNEIYELFGVAQYVEQLRAANQTEDLSKLDQMLSEFILLKGIEDLSEEAKEQLNAQPINDAVDLYKFFVAHIENFNDRFEAYGKEFQDTILNG